MLFPNSKPVLILLTGSISDMLNECLISTKVIVEIHYKHKGFIEELQLLTKDTIENYNLLKGFDERVNDLTYKSPK